MTLKAAALMWLLASLLRRGWEWGAPGLAGKRVGWYCRTGYSHRPVMVLLSLPCCCSATTADAQGIRSRLRSFWTSPPWTVCAAVNGTAIWVS